MGDSIRTMVAVKRERLQRLGSALKTHAEDIALATGAMLLGAGAGGAFGWPFGAMVLGALLVAYGVWITRTTRR